MGWYVAPEPDDPVYVNLAMSRAKPERGWKTIARELNAAGDSFPVRLDLAPQRSAVDRCESTAGEDSPEVGRPGMFRKSTTSATPEKQLKNAT
jgi:hypothetical protein